MGEVRESHIPHGFNDRVPKVVSDVRASCQVKLVLVLTAQTGREGAGRRCRLDHPCEGLDTTGPAGDAYVCASIIPSFLAGF